MATTFISKKWKDKSLIIQTLHIIILLLCLLLIAIISIDIFKRPPQLTHQLYMRIQFWICIVFIGDFFIEFFLSERRLHYFTSHLLFLLVSIPYMSIIEYGGVHFDAGTTYLIRFVPLIRGGYALAIIVSWLTANKAATLLLTYLTILLSTVYFSSLLFYTVEQGLNPLVLNYGDAIWWAFMDVTTVGSNIYAVTPLGQILSVLLAAMGMMMFPIGTVYITDRVSKENKKRKEEMEKEEMTTSTASK